MPAWVWVWGGLIWGVVSLVLAVPVLVTVFVVTFASLRGPERSTRGLALAMFIGAAPLGVIGFCGGFYGPILLDPDANQGPLLGILITGPSGFALGGLAGALWWRLVRVPAGGRS